MPTSEEVSPLVNIDAAAASTRPRLHINENVKRNAKGAVRTAVDALSVVASATQDVPYLGPMSGALNAVLKIYNEVGAYKAEWKAVASTSQKIKEIVDEAHAKCNLYLDRHDGSLPPVIIEPLSKLEESLLRTVETLAACMPTSTGKQQTSIRKRITGFARQVLNRGDLADSVKQCRVDMQTTLELFNTRLHIDQTLTMHSLVEMFKQWEKKAPRTSAVSGTLSSLPPAPAIFHGRAQEVDHVADLVLHKAPAHVAILGPGGIGKTSIALTVLHHSEVVARYVDRRYFLSCEAIATADGVVQELSKVFGLICDDDASISPMNRLLCYLETQSDVILCLDNLETPWDADIQAVEDLLSQMTALAHVALIVTSRGTDRPKQVSWTRPFLSPIEPLTLDAALGTWDAICDGHDAYAVELVQAVDCVPLAVTLLAHLSESELPEALWSRWQYERTELLRVRGPDHHLNNVDISVQLSLQSPRIQDDEGTVQFLSVLCTLPQGLLESRIAAFADAYSELLPNLRRSITVLKQSSLAYSSPDGFLRVLSPVRSYIQSYSPISDELLVCLNAIYCTLVEYETDDCFTIVSHAKGHIQRELGNITAVLRLSIRADRCVTERTLLSVASLARLCNNLDIYDTVLLDEAILHWGRDYPKITAQLWVSKSISLFKQNRAAGDATSALSRARELFLLINDQSGLALCLVLSAEIDFKLFRYSEAEESAKAALNICHTIGRDAGKVRSLLCLGCIYDDFARYEEAEHTLRSALDIACRIEDPLLQALVYTQLATMLTKQKRFSEEKAMLHSAMELYETLDDNEGKAGVLRSMANMHSRLGQPDKAVAMLQSVLQLSRESGSRSGEVATLNLLGREYRKLDRREEARAVLICAREIATAIADVYGGAHATYYLGLLLCDCDELDEAELYLRDVFGFFKRFQDRYNMKKCRRAIRKVSVQRTALAQRAQEGRQETGSTKKE